MMNSCHTCKGHVVTTLSLWLFTCHCCQLPAASICSCPRRYRTQRAREREPHRGPHTKERRAAGFSWRSCWNAQPRNRRRDDCKRTPRWECSNWTELCVYLYSLLMVKCLRLGGLVSQPSSHPPLVLYATQLAAQVTLSVV